MADRDSKLPALTKKPKATKKEQRQMKAGLDDAMAIFQGRARNPSDALRDLNLIRKVLHRERDKIPAGSDQALAHLYELLAAIEAATAAAERHFAPSIAEAKELFAAVKDADLPTIERYLIEHPPSAMAIAFLVDIARRHFQSERGRTAAQARVDARGDAMDSIQRQFIATGSGYDGRADFVRVNYDIWKKTLPGLDVRPGTIERAWLRKVGKGRKSPR